MVIEYLTEKSIDDMEFLIEHTPKDHIVILGADTQQCLGPLKAFDSTDIMGEYVMGHRDWRRDCFLKLLYSYNLHLPHTFVEGFDLRFTCFNNGKSDPKQIDYMATTAAKKWIVQAKVAESSATDSDHWPLSFGLLPKSQKFRPAAKTENNWHKPINWQPVEIDYNDKIRESVGAEMPVDVAEIAQNAYHIFTDGSFTGHRNHMGRHKNRAPRNNLPPTPCRAGWGVAFFDRGPEPTDTWEAWEHIGRRLEGKAGTKMELFNGTLQGRVTTTAAWENGGFGPRRGEKEDEQHGGDPGGLRDFVLPTRTT